jgi:hypothetical protein
MRNAAQDDKSTQGMTAIILAIMRDKHTMPSRVPT